VGRHAQLAPHIFPTPRLLACILMSCFAAAPAPLWGLAEGEGEAPPPLEKAEQNRLRALRAAEACLGGAGALLWSAERCAAHRADRPAAALDPPPTADPDAPSTLADVAAQARPRAVIFKVLFGEM
jgi:hypothetical protein